MSFKEMIRRGSKLFRQVAFGTLGIACVAVAQSPDDAATKPPKPIIKLIETYGLRTVARSSVIDASEFKAGDILQESSVARAIERIEAIPGVRKAAVAAIYGNLLRDETLGMVVYVGIEEKGSPPLQFGEGPSGNAALPAEIVEANDKEQQAFRGTAARGQFGEDRSQGHSLSTDPELRAAQEQFIPLAITHWDTLVEVVHNSRDSTQRAIAAKVIAYAKDKETVVRELTPALHDPDGAVRNNSTRALSLVFGYAKAHLEHRIIPPDDLVQRLIYMLDSLEWTDRNKATALLLSIDEHEFVLRELRKRAIPSLVEMSNWESTHGAMAFMLLGRLDNMTHDESRSAWQGGRQARVIVRVQEAATTK